MSFKTQLVADNPVFLNSDEFAESVIYEPHGAAPKTIKAVINRGPFVDSIRLGQHAFNAKVVDLQIANDATLGVTNPKAGIDYVQLKVKLSDLENTRLVVTQILESDEGFYRLECVA